jgi:predicted DNA-binding transcriptional regulator AlpA
MKPKRIVREPEACDRLGCRRTKFRTAYRFNDPAEPNVPGTTDIPRLRPVPLGARNVGFLENEIDEMVERLAKRRDDPEVARELLERRNRLLERHRKAQQPPDTAEADAA